MILVRKKGYILFKALGHPIRFEIVEMLSRKGELCACKIYEAFDISQPGISKQLSVLKELGVLKSRRQGTWIYYSINQQAIDAILSITGDLKRNTKRGVC